ncbi:MAG: type II secretion system F family protein [Anaerolineae bacterium]|nr:type II secretion system F family protein [Anaerolineae bacterium]
MLYVYVILGLGFLLTIGVIVAGVVMSRRDSGVALERLEQITAEEVIRDTEGEGDSVAGRTSESVLTQKLDQVLEERGLGRKVAIDLARADLKLTVAEFWAMTVISVILTGGVSWILFHRNWIFLLGGAIFGYFIPKIVIKTRQKSRLKKFNNQLGDGITLMANGLRAGYSLLQSINAVAEEMPPPISMEFRRVVQEIGLGIHSERAFNNLLRRVPSDDLDLMITAIGVQSEVGGNLAEILEIIGFVIRERVRIKGEIQVLTAQGQMSGYVITFLPIVLGLILYAMNQEYIGRMIFTCESRGVSDDLCSQPCGWIMIGAGLLTISAGFFAIQKIIDIDV